ncbi:MAG: protein arginine kinase [Clostridiales bacterium]|nr:protein arginine kinase [Clostridiales bacterium]
MIWYKEKTDNDIIVSTRVRLARNLDKFPFPALLSEEGKNKVTEKVKSAVLGSNSTLAGDFSYIKMSDLKDSQRQELAEKHLISLDMAQDKTGSVLINKEENMSIMLMEEDHIRIQIIMGGAKLSEAWDLANKVDDVIEENVDYAFSEEFGYLTACPTNTGTGMRASVMMHLPALTVTNNMSKIISSASALGLTVRGLYGEGSKAYGCLYQISNQVTLGMSENEIIEQLENVVRQIEKHERDARESLKKNEGYCDKLWRSYGILKYARSVSSSEAKALISDVILGKNLGIIDIKGKLPETELMVESEPALIMAGEQLTPEARDKRRAEFLRENI